MTLKEENTKIAMIAAAFVAVLAGVFSLPKPAEAKLSEGERLWFQCRACHTLKAKEPHKLGPNLHGFMNVRAGSRRGFRYSKALKNTKLVWNYKNLDKWIERPNSVISGHRMVYSGMRDARKRAVLIKFMKEQTAK